MTKLKNVPQFLHGLNIKLSFLKYILGIRFKYVSTAQTYAQARGAYTACTIENTEKSFVNLRAMIKHARTFDEALEALSETRLNSPEANDALTKVELFATISSIPAIQAYIAQRKESEMSWGERHRLFELWNELSFQRLKQNATTPDSCLRAYHQAPPYSPARMAILKQYTEIAKKEKVLELFKTMYKQNGVVESELGVLMKPLLTAISAKAL